MKVPNQLKHLRRDRRGLPVPFVNRWGKGEHLLRLKVEFDPFVGGPAVFYEDELEPEPDFTAQNFGRQRACVIGGLCQVCARKLAWHERNVVISSVSTEQVTTPGPIHGGVVITEPWLCDFCCTFAMEVCPALIRRKKADDMTRVRLVSKNDADIYVSTGSIEGPLAEETKQRPVALWAKIALPRIVIERVGVEEFRLERERRRGMGTVRGAL